MRDWTELDGWVQVALVVTGAVWASVFGALVYILSMGHRLSTAERDIKAHKESHARDIESLKNDHTAWLKAVELKVNEMRIEVRQDLMGVQEDIQAVATRAELRHNELMQALIPGRRK